jgi:hypothetical protein
MGGTMVTDSHAQGQRGVVTVLRARHGALALLRTFLTDDAFWMFDCVRLPLARGRHAAQDTVCVEGIYSGTDAFF